RVNYRKPLNFTWEGMQESREALGRIDDWLKRLREVTDVKALNDQRGEEFEQALDDNLNTSGALGFLFETIRDTNRAMDAGSLDSAVAGGWLSWWNRINQILDLESQDI